MAFNQLTRIRHGELVRRNTWWLKRVGQSLSRNGRWPPPAPGRSLRVNSIGFVFGVVERVRDGTFACSELLVVLFPILHRHPVVDQVPVRIKHKQQVHSNQVPSIYLNPVSSELVH
uniref:(northern house mosquito) hypothetical protein n=1 Tax=Culex pipiens TaxID=7175 RepID=A0A8D8CDQ8_CULPI